MRHFISITSLDIEEFIKVFIYTIYKLYSTLNTIISNRGSLFISNLSELQLEVIYYIYSLSLIGHLGCIKILNLFN